MGRRCVLLLVSISLVAACKGGRTAAPAAVATSVSIAPAAASSAPIPPPPPRALATTTEAQRELEAIRAARKVCDADATAPECETGQTLAREYPLMHCGQDGIDPAYTFAWAAEEPLPGASPFKDENGQTWYVEAARSPKLARVDERIWSESGWLSVEPRLRFEAEYPSATDAKRLAVLDVQIKKKTQAAGIVRAVFYNDEFIGAFSFYTPLEPQLDGGMLFGFLTTPKAHPLCKTPEPRKLPADLEDFAGTWSRIH